MRKAVLTIAGFDPSGGAGILADIKTFESCEVLGVAACSAITVQNDSTFQSVEWIGLTKICEQLDVLIDRYNIQHVKIGLIQSVSVMHDLVNYLTEKCNDLVIVWDPVLSASSKFQFHKEIDYYRVINIAKKISLITPNTAELFRLVGVDEVDSAAEFLSKYCPVLVTGGTNKNDANDLLYNNGTCEVIEGSRSLRDKHGTGCVHSSAITAFMANGNKMPEACSLAKQYVTDYINSSEELIGYHRLMSQ